MAEAEELGRHFYHSSRSAPRVRGAHWALPSCRFRRDAALGLGRLCRFSVAVVHVGTMLPSETVFKFKSAREDSSLRKIPPLPPETGLAFFECYPNGLPFYLGRSATLFTTDGREITSSRNYILYRFKHDPMWPTNLISVTNFDGWISGRHRPVYLVAPEQNRPKLETIPGVQSADIKPLTQTYIRCPVAGSVKFQVCAGSAAS